MPGRTLLSVLLLLSSSCAVWCATLCNNRCCSFLEGFPARLKVLRENYSNIREYYTPFACHVMDGILKLYLDSVLPRALASVTVETRDLQPHVESIQQILDQLKTEVNNCVSTRVFLCAMLRSARPRRSAGRTRRSLLESLLSKPPKAFGKLSTGQYFRTTKIFKGS
ncbi:unnamed protein product [Tetraodon nigroviridis]|uniref:(spotted green pufferfish) hypothetical protein n=1 Tax=Tetraodon nigroviridis TaxID=99883 RepID=Q4SR99_TETNG|nr:unnamed protein product [Tetraodon nigroviridis]